MPLPDLKVIDLSHPITAGMPVWPGDPAVVVERLAHLQADGYNLNRLCIGEHTGTHVGAPRHFLDDGETIEALPPEQLFLPGIKVEHAAQPDDLIGLAEIKYWESIYGKIPANHAVVLQTGWDRFWPDEPAYFSRDARGGMHFPGLSLAAASYLIDSCGVRAIGIDSAGVDGGQSLDFAVDVLLARRNGIHIENLTHLEQLPDKDFYLCIGALPIGQGTGSPARILGLVLR